MFAVPALTVEELQAELATDTPPFLLDVREANEHAFCALSQSTLLPLGTLGDEASQEALRENFGHEASIVVYCHHGGRSARAVQFLQTCGYQNVRNLTGGIHAWATNIDPTIPTY